MNMDISLSVLYRHPASSKLGRYQNTGKLTLNPMRDRLAIVLLILCAAAGWLAVGADKAVRSGAVSQSKSPPAPAVRKIKLEPASITLEDGKDSRKILVFGETADKTRVDLTARAVLKSDSSII